LEFELDSPEQSNFKVNSQKVELTEFDQLDPTETEGSLGSFESFRSWNHLVSTLKTHTSFQVCSHFLNVLQERITV